jgi:hypothetical protein
MAIHAICDVGYIPIRKEPASVSEMLTCLVFGEIFELLESKENWHLIKTAFDNYTGWISTKKIFEVSDDFTGQWKTEQRFYSFDLFQQVSVNGQCRVVAYGSVLPLYNQHQFNLSVKSCNICGAVFKEDKTLGVDFILEQAWKLMGIPYLWGGRNTFGIDCSGLVQTLFKLTGVYLPRDAYQQKEIGEEVPFEKIKKGDLAFFMNGNGKTTHVGLLDGDGSIIHASGLVRKDVFDEQGIFNRQIDKHTHKLQCIKRVVYK